MHGWETVDTARCTRCAIYTPTSDLVLGPDQKPYCIACGPPVRTAPPVSSLEEDWEVWASPARRTLERPARVVAALMVFGAIAFPLAACVSQL
jgi:hypothetical protein